MRLAVIPARGGSKRIPRKNIRPFAGRPMIGWAIQAARESGLFDAIVVSTDDEEIANVARQLGARIPFMRPAALADDHAATLPVVAHAIRACAEQGLAADEVCCIYPGVPLLRGEDLCDGHDLLLPGHYAFPVLAFGSPIQRALRRTPAGNTVPFHPEHTHTRTQDLEPAYHDAGQFYWAHAQTWLAGLPVHQHARTLVLPATRAVDIDTPADWLRAEALFRAQVVDTAEALA